MLGSLLPAIRSQILYGFPTPVQNCGKNTEVKTAEQHAIKPILAVGDVEQITVVVKLVNLSNSGRWLRRANALQVIKYSERSEEARNAGYAQ